MPDQDVNANEGADPTDDIKKQNDGAPSAANDIAADDPHKTEKLAGLGKPQGAKPASE